MVRRAKALRLLLPAVVHGQRPAAALAARDDHVAALHGQHPGGGRVDAGEERALHAAGEQADHRAAGPARADPLGQAGPARPSRGASDSIARSDRRQPVQQAAAPDQPLQPAGLVGPQRAAQQPQPPRVGEQREDRPRAAAGRPRPTRCAGARPAARVASMSRSYCTPDGQAVTQAMQPRQASKCPTIESLSGSPSRPGSIR